jgi:transcriptional regulator with XRE-family HTH domain
MELKQLRRMAGLTQFELSQRCNTVSRMRLSLAECGQLKLRPEEECTIRELLLELMASRAAQIKRVLSQEAVAV